MLDRDHTSQIPQDHPTQIPVEGHQVITAQGATNQGGSNSALVVTIGGYAVAAGDNTLADGTIHSTVQDFGPITEAIDYASFTAVAASQPGDPAVAATGTFANVSGADFVFELTLQSGPSAGTGGTVSSTTQTELMAIDVAGWSPATGPVVVDLTLNTPTPPGGSQYALVGHLAAITADA